MTTKTIKTILFASLIAAMILPFSTMNYAEATIDNKSSMSLNIQEGTVMIQKISSQADGISAPVLDGINTGLKLQWDIIVDHDVQQVESRKDTNICGQKFYVNGFYDTKYNKRGASYQIPKTINGICNIDADLKGYVNLTLDKVDYRLQGDGNTTKKGSSTNTSWYKFFSDGYGNSGKEYITITAYYKHTT